MRGRCLNVIWITGALCSLAAGGVKINLEKRTFLSRVCTITIENKTKHNVVFEQLGPSVLTTLHDPWVCIPPPLCLSAVPVDSERPCSFSLPCAQLGIRSAVLFFMYPICRMKSSVIDLKLPFLGTHRAFRILLFKLAGDAQTSSLWWNICFGAVDCAPCCSAAMLPCAHKIVLVLNPYHDAKFLMTPGT